MAGWQADKQLSKLMLWPNESFSMSNKYLSSVVSRVNFFPYSGPSIKYDTKLKIQLISTKWLGIFFFYAIGEITDVDKIVPGMVYCEPERENNNDKV